MTPSIEFSMLQRLKTWALGVHSLTKSSTQSPVLSHQSSVPTKGPSAPIGHRESGMKSSPRLRPATASVDRAEPRSSSRASSPVPERSRGAVAGTISCCFFEVLTFLMLTFKMYTPKKLTDGFDFYLSVPASTPLGHRGDHQCSVSTKGPSAPLGHRESCLKSSPRLR
jgi:hypothetical protein